MKKLVILHFLLMAGFIHAQKPELVIQREGHTAEVERVCFSPDERQALSGGRDNRIVLWDLDSRKFVCFIQADTALEFLCFGPTGQTAVALLANKSLNAWNLANGQRLWRVQPGAYQSLVQRGDSLMLVHEDNTTSCWDLTSGKKRWQRVVKMESSSSIAPPPGLAARLQEIAAQISVNQVAYTKDGLKAVVALGNPTAFWTITPGAPLNRDGFGALIIWDMKKDTLAFPQIDLPEMVHAVALSGDGMKCLSASSDRTVRLWDLVSGKELARLEREPSLETRVSFSSDFRRVALFRLDNTLKTFDLDQRSRFVSRKDYWGANTFRFTAGGKELITASRDGSIVRLGGTTLDSLLRFQPDQHMEVIHSLAISPDGKKLLVGSAKESRFMFLTRNEIPKKEVKGYILNDQKDTIGFETATGRVYVNPIGSRFAGSEKKDVLQFMPNVNVTALWDLEKGQLERVMYPYDHEGWIYDQRLAFSPDGRLALANIQGKWTAWNAGTGELIRNEEGHKQFHAVHFDDRGGHALTILPGGRLSKWNLNNGEVEKTYENLGQPRATALNASGEKGLALGSDGVLREWDARTGSGIRQISTGKIPEAPELEYTPNENFVLVRGKGTADIWNLAVGKPVLRLGQTTSIAFLGDSFWDGHTGDQVSLFEFLPDGRTAVSATYDGTIKFWDFSTGKEICTLLFLGQSDWAVTTPSGLFDASDGAMQSMYFRLGTEILELEQLKERYFEPGLLQKLLGYAKGGLRPVDELNSLALYPKIQKAVIEGDRIKVQLQPRNGGIGRVSLLLNDKIELEPNVNPGFKPVFEVDLRPFDGYFFPDSLNRLSLRAYNRDGWLKGQPYPLLYNPTSSKGAPGSGQLVSLTAKKDSKLDSINLYALVVGTSNFRGSQLNLKYPDKDAEAFAQAIRLAGTPLFGKNIEIKLLTTSAEPYPRKQVVAKALAEIAAKSDPNDILLVYFSGHGVTYPPNSEKGQFYYLTTDILGDKLDDPATLRTQAIAQDTLQAWIRKVKAQKRILILDACNSGRVVETLSPGQKALNSDQRRALERMNDRSGMFVLAGSAADKSSFEASRYGHGLLTYSLLNNMPLVAASNRSLIDVGKLFSTTLEEVPRLAQDIGKEQQPELIGAESFDIGIIDLQEKFPTPQALPVFVRTVFMDSQQNKDLQRLSKAVNGYLDQLAADKQPALVFSDIEEFAGDHYYIGGLYQVNGNTISGKATVYRKDKTLGTFPFSGPKDQLKTLAEQIVNQAFDQLGK